jgi:hypothetical protein
MGAEIELRRQRRHTQIELDAHALYLQSERDFTYQQIADEMGSSVSTAHRRIRRAYARLPGAKASERKAAALAEIDRLRVLAWAVAERKHFIVTPGGKLVTVKVQDAEGNVHEVPLSDDGPALDAARLILSVQERETRYTGNDAPVRHRVQVVPQDMVDAEIAELKREQGLDEDDDADLADLL